MRGDEREGIAEEREGEECRSVRKDGEVKSGEREKREEMRARGVRERGREE